MKRFEDGSGGGTKEDVLSFLPVRDVGLGDLVLPPETVTALRGLCARATSGGLVAAVTGAAGVGKTAAVRACAEELRLDTWSVDCALLVRLHGARSVAALPDVLARGERPHAVMLFHDAAWLFEQVAGGAGERLLRLASSRRPPTVLESRSALPVGEALVAVQVVLPAPDPGAREELWRRLAWRAHPLLELDAARLAAVDAPGATIERVLEEALRDAAGRAPTTDEILARLRSRGA